MGVLNKEQVAKAATRISSDIKSRKGIGDEWEAIDKETRKNILENWTDIIWTEITGEA